MVDSILTSVKKALGIAEEYEHFDPEIIMLINSFLAILNQVGIGPPAGFSIQDKSATCIFAGQVDLRSPFDRGSYREHDERNQRG